MGIVEKFKQGEIYNCKKIAKEIFHSNCDKIYEGLYLIDDNNTCIIFRDCLSEHLKSDYNKENNALALDIKELFIAKEIKKKISQEDLEKIKNKSILFFDKDNTDHIIFNKTFNKNPLYRFCGTLALSGSAKPVQKKVISVENKVIKILKKQSFQFDLKLEQTNTIKDLNDLIVI